MASKATDNADNRVATQTASYKEIQGEHKVKGEEKEFGVIPAAWKNDWAL